MTRGEWYDGRGDPYDDAHEDGCDGECVKGLCCERARLLEDEAEDDREAGVDTTPPVCAKVIT